MTFILGILIVSIIFSLQPFVKKNIMTEFTIDEYTVYSPLIALIIFFIGSIFKGLDFKDLKSKIKEIIKKTSFLILFLKHIFHIN